MKETLYTILYKGRKIYHSITAEDCSEILQDFSEQFFSSEEIDPNEIEIIEES